MSSATLQDDSSVESFFNVAETETLALFEHLFFEFLEEFDVFAPAQTGRTREHEPPELMRGFLHCYYHDIYGIRPVERELRNTVVWLSCGFDRPPSRGAADRFLTDLERVVDEVFDRLDLLYRFNRREGDARRSRRIEVLRSNRRRVLPRLRLYNSLDRAKDPDCG